MRMFFILILMLISSCAYRPLKNEPNKSGDRLSKPDNIYLEESIRSAVDSIKLYHQTALKTLALEDTFGARVYYEGAFDIVNSFDPATSSVLQSWYDYDSLLSRMTSEYEQIYSSDVFDTEAEEVLEDIYNEEEIYIVNRKIIKKHYLIFREEAEKFLLSGWNEQEDMKI